jgi:hypothetical protein
MSKGVQRFTAIPRPQSQFHGTGPPPLSLSLAGIGGPQGTTNTTTTSTTTAPELSPRGKHVYPPLTPWSCNHIAAWLGLVFAFTALVLVCILYFPREEHHEWSEGGGGDGDKRRVALLSSGGGGAEHENYVVFKFQNRDVSGLTRWPEAGVVSGLQLDHIASTRLCCIVGIEEYFVCDSGQGFASNLGLAYVVRNVKQEGGAHLLIAASSADMNGATCIFSWQSRVSEHDKAALVASAASKAIAPPTPSASLPIRRLGHIHEGRNRRGNE